MCFNESNLISKSLEAGCSNALLLLCFTCDQKKKVLLQAMKEEPPLNAKCKDKFLIQSTLITPEKESLPLADLVRCCPSILLTRHVSVVWIYMKAYSFHFISIFLNLANYFLSLSTTFLVGERRWRRTKSTSTENQSYLSSTHRS